MTDNTAAKGYFADAQREGAVSAKLKDKKDYVKGKIVDLFESPMTKFGSQDPILNDDGSQRHQLVIVLQTDSRNWEKVAKVPTGADGSPKDPKLDDGKRAVYVPRYTNIYAALGKALKAAEVDDPEIGGEFGIVVEDLQDTGKGNPLKVHRAKYTKPEPGTTPAADDGEDPLADVGDLEGKKSAVQDAPREATSEKAAKVAEEAEAASADDVEEPPF